LALATGVLAGLCVLCRPEFLVWLVASVFAFVLVVKQPRRFGRAALACVAAAIVVSPWAIRNLVVFGRPIVTTTHGGHTLLLGNNPSFYEYLRSGPWGSVWTSEGLRQSWIEARNSNADPDAYPPAAVIHTPTGLRPDELAVDRWSYRQAFKHIRAEPAMFAYSCLVRVGRLWAVLPHQTSADESPTRRGLRYAVGIWYAFELMLAALGAWFLRGQLFKHPWLWATLLVLSLTLVHAFYWTDMRMRAPLMPVVALAAAYGALVLACGRQAISAESQAA
jgi:hypothetical protein